MADAPKITRDDLAKLLQAKIRLSAEFSAAAKAIREHAPSANTYDPIGERIDLDLAERAALDLSCAADKAYNEALDAFVKQGAN